MISHQGGAMRTPSAIAIIVGLLLIAVSPAASAASIDAATAHKAAESAVRLRGHGGEPQLIAAPEKLGVTLFYVFSVEPTGFVIVAGDTELPPVIAYSFASDLPTAEPERGILLGLMTTDLSLRLEQVPRLPLQMVEERRGEWQRLLSEEPTEPSDVPLEQWPPAGTTSTGGWLETNWDQGSPHNDQCPLDPVAGGRTVAGCPAVAMAQILNYHRTTNGTQLDDSDDYYHSYAGRQYWIDDDWASLGFPSFPTLSASLATLEDHYRTQATITDADKAALVFACGVAARQVYTSSASGTFGVDQAEEAYLRFGVDSIELLDDTDPDLYDRLSQNMMNALPAHLAVVNATATSGHNLVVDGYNTDGYYHLNFGWGGAANGWYLIPDEIPYGLTVLEGVIVDIVFQLFEDGFETGDTTRWSSGTGK
jgi:hypothetical protein